MSPHRLPLPLFLLLLVVLSAAAMPAPPRAEEERPRAREAGVVVGTLPTGPNNAITDVAGVLVGQATLSEAGRIQTGVTAILPHGGNLFDERVPAAIVVGNGFGKLLGVTQVGELGELETPILLAGTLSVWRAADALVSWMLKRPGMEEVRSINPVVGETNDGYLSDIRARPVGEAEVAAALESAKGGAVEEGAVGAGRGTMAFGWKGGIGTSSRLARIDGTDYSVGVLVQSNYGGDLTIAGVPVGRRLAARATAAEREANRGGDGSIMIVVATDAPLDVRQLERLAARALVGLSRTGSVLSNGSGDYVIAFSTAEGVRRHRGERLSQSARLGNDAITPLFQAAAEATEEAILNSLFKAVPLVGHRGEAKALPLDEVLALLREAGAVE
jgi:D-aminopeptidase